MEYFDPKFVACRQTAQARLDPFPAGTPSMAYGWQAGHENPAWIASLLPKVSTFAGQAITLGQKLTQATGGFYLADFATFVNTLGVPAIICINGFTDTNADSAGKMEAASTRTSAPPPKSRPSTAFWPMALPNISTPICCLWWAPCLYISEVNDDPFGTMPFEAYLYNGVFLAEYVARMSTIPNVKAVGVVALYLGNNFQLGMIRAVNDFQNYLIGHVDKNPNFSTNTATDPNTQFSFYYSASGLAMTVANEAINNSTHIWPPP